MDFPVTPFLRKGSTGVEKLRFSRMVETSWTETSASALDDDAADGVEVAGALINKGKLHKPKEPFTNYYTFDNSCIDLTGGAGAGAGVDAGFATGRSQVVSPVDW